MLKRFLEWFHGLKNEVRCDVCGKWGTWNNSKETIIHTTRDGAIYTHSAQIIRSKFFKKLIQEFRKR